MKQYIPEIIFSHLIKGQSYTYESKAAPESKPVWFIKLWLENVQKLDLREGHRDVNENCRVLKVFRAILQDMLHFIFKFSLPLQRTFKSY